MFPTAAVPVHPPPWGPAGSGTGHPHVLEQVCPWASPGQRLPIMLSTPSSVTSGSCQGKHGTGVLLSPVFFFVRGCFYLIFLMILQRSPNDGDEGTGQVLLWGVWDCHPLAGEDGHRNSPAAWGSATKVQAATGKLSVSRDVLLAQA